MNVSASMISASRANGQRLAGRSGKLGYRSRQSDHRHNESCDGARDPDVEQGSPRSDGGFNDESPLPVFQFQLLTQVAGRAGRGRSPGKVILQTFFQDHYAVQYAARHDFNGFDEKELQFRSWMHYPPYSALANVLVRSDKVDGALEWSGLLGKWLNQTRHEGVRVLGPAAAPIIRLKRDYRYHFVLKSPSREKLNTTLRTMLIHATQQKIPRTQVIVDMDALWLM